VDVQLILSEYNKLKESPSLPMYKDFIRSFISKIEVGRYFVDITIKTGLDIFDELDSRCIVRREAIYNAKRYM